ncbi:MAG: Fe-S cluster assembly protein SufD [Candidatus Tumulicola sp.]
MLKSPEPVVLGEDLRRELQGSDGVLPHEIRTQALDRFFSVRSGRERPGRYWRIDLESIVPEATPFAAGGSVRIDNPHARVTACDLATAARAHPQLLARAFGATRASATKFGALAMAFAELGAFVYVPADAMADDPILITYTLAAGASTFPYTVVLAERGAGATIVERIEGGGSGAFVCGATEIVTLEGADVTYASCQQLNAGSRIFQTRAAKPGRDARVTWACAELGSDLAVCDLSVAIECPGAEASVTTLFFPSGSQHVDVVSTIDHVVGDSRSQTMVKSAAVDHGQARYLGNIRIAPGAQGSDASLRDDALLLSANANIDSVPALEIGANDVKAFHGATVGALDAEQIFYMETRGIERNAAERMIALGFFEPAIARFPNGTLRDRIRAALAAKLP